MSEVEELLALAWVKELVEGRYKEMLKPEGLRDNTYAGWAYKLQAWLNGTPEPKAQDHKQYFVKTLGESDLTKAKKRKKPKAQGV